ncbi:MAG TPA: hypothetical protein DCE41_26120 [Cytophagales bacterium]|nr:hypothetical protein [Cytophagales bacterium]HAA21563.1 hypothetical protein [Cytophagales bacterium]HAP59042.1 hypothetical protein [Cytophagales bacterium]
MQFLYQLGIHLYGILIRIVAPFVPKAKEWVVGRKQWRNQVSLAAASQAPVVWMHCSSVGEFEDSRVVWQALQEHYTGAQFVLTFFSSSGYNHLKDRGVADTVLYLPLDTKKNAHAFLDRLQPKLVFFSRSDLWANMLAEVKGRQIPLYLLGLRLERDSKFLNRWTRGFFKACFQSFTHIYAQHEITREILSMHFGVSEVSVVGNARVDRIAQASEAAPRYPRVAEFVGDHFCVILGSGLPTEEKMFLSLAEDPALAKVRWLLVPHEIEQEYLDARAQDEQKTETLFTLKTPLLPTQRVMWVDTIGHLKHLYQYAHLAVVGGGFDTIGIHSILEPAVYGLPIWFGPNHRNYPEALDLMSLNGARVFENQDQLREAILYQLKNGMPAGLSERISSYVTENTGASKRTLAELMARHPKL